MTIKFDLAKDYWGFAFIFDAKTKTFSGLFLCVGMDITFGA